MQDIQRILKEAHRAGKKTLLTHPLSGFPGIEVVICIRYIQQNHLGFFQLEDFQTDYDSKTASRVLVPSTTGKCIVSYGFAFLNEVRRYGFHGDLDIYIKEGTLKKIDLSHLARRLL